MGQSIVGKHGFPDNIGSVEGIIALAQEIGKGLEKRQDEIVAIYKGEKKPTQDLYIWDKGDGSVVTSADRWANTAVEKGVKRSTNRHLVAGLRKIASNSGAGLAMERRVYPYEGKIGIVTEEAEDAVNLKEINKQVVLMADPLDNTKDYITGGRDWGVMIGCMENGVPTGGVAYYPKWGLTFYIGDDGGAFVRDADDDVSFLHCNKPKSINDVINGKTHLKAVVSDEMKPMSINLKRDEKGRVKSVVPNYEVAPHTKRYWSVMMSEKLAKRYNLPGGKDIAFHGPLYDKWDTLAVDAILRRAGGMIVDNEGKPLNYFANVEISKYFKLPETGFMAGDSELLKLISPAKAQERGR